MATATRKCKVCGCEYEYCHTQRLVAGVFRWQDVACCQAHGQEYLERVLASRSQNGVATETSETSKPKKIRKKVKKVVEEDDSLGEPSKEDFDDDAEEPVIETK